MFYIFCYFLVVIKASQSRALHKRSSRGQPPFPRLFRPEWLAVCFLTLAILGKTSSAFADNSDAPGHVEKLNQQPKPNKDHKDKIKNCRGSSQSEAIAESIAQDSGASPEQYAKYSDKLASTLGQFTAAQLNRILNGN